MLALRQWNSPQNYTKNARMASNKSEHVVHLLFLSERCVVSKAALQLMELVHQTLKVENIELTLLDSVGKYYKDLISF